MNMTRPFNGRIFVCINLVIVNVNKLSWFCGMCIILSRIDNLTYQSGPYYMRRRPMSGFHFFRRSSSFHMIRFPAFAGDTKHWQLRIPLFSLPPVMADLTVAHYLLSDKDNQCKNLFYDDTESLSSHDIIAKSVQLARTWRDANTIKSGDVVALVTANSPRFLVIVFALHLLGAIPSPCNPRAKVVELGHQLKLCNARTIITTSPLLQAALQALETAGFESNTSRIYLLTGSDNAQSLDPIFLQASSPDIVYNSSEWTSTSNMAFICWSSGTSGQPKAVPLSHANIIANLVQFEARLGDRFNTFNNNHHVHIDVLPQFHAYGLITTLYAFRSRTPRYMMESFHPIQFAEIAFKSKVTFSMLVPAAILAIAKTKIDPKMLETVQSIASGASPLPGSVRDTLKEKYNIVVTDGYGCTEASPLISAQNPADAISGKKGVGRICPGLDVRIVSTENNQVLSHATSESVDVPGQVGEIRIKGENVFAGYLGAAIKEGVFDEDGYYMTGDMGVVDADCHLAITDRTKDLIKYNGFQVSPSELETLLTSHPSVKDAAVIGVWDEAQATELPKAFVVADPAAIITPELTKRVIDYVDKQVSGYKKLRGGVEWIEAIPRNAASKTLRNELRNRAKGSSAPALSSLPADVSTAMKETPVGSESEKASPSSKKSKNQGMKLDGFSNLLLQMDEESYRPACFSIYTFTLDVEISTMHKFFQRLVSAYPKYQQVLTHRGKKFSVARWIDHHEVEWAKDWKIEDNIREMSLITGQNGRRAFFQTAGDFIAAPFDYTKPVWEALLVHNIDSNEYEGKAAVMIKVHHCFSDGQGMIQSYHTALESLKNNVTVSAVQSHASKAKPSRNYEFKTTGRDTIKHTFKSIERLFFIRSRNAFVYTKTKKQSRPQGRYYGHSKGIAMSDIGLVRKAFSTNEVKISLNDVVCAIATLAFRRHAARMVDSQALKDRSIVFLIPISLRPKDNWDLYNFSSGGLAWFNWGKKEELTFESILLQVHKEMGMIKRSKFPELALSTLNATMKLPFLYLPRWYGLRGIWEKAYSQYHIMTNVPGPRKRVSFLDAEASAYHVLPPSSPGRGSMAVGLISYADNFSIAISCDQVEEFSELCMDLCQSFEQVAAEVVMEAGKRLKNASANTID